MNAIEIFAEFSRNRLDGEPVPDDLKILLPLRDDLAKRTGVRLEWAEKWAPWLDTNEPGDAERRDPDDIAKLLATREVCGYIAFVAVDEDGRYFGYWRGPTRRKVEHSPLVIFDQAGHFHLCIASTFAEAVLEKEYGHERFDKLRAWYRALGIPIGWESPSQMTFPHEKITPKDLYKVLFERHRSTSSR